MERIVEDIALTTQSTDWFRHGLGIASGLHSGAWTEFQDPADFLLEHSKVETNEGFAVVCGILARLEAVKGKGYLASFMKRGTESVWANIERKYDRLDNIINNGLEGKGDAITNLGDLAVYCIKEITRRSELYPDEFKKWIEEVRSLS